MIRFGYNRSAGKHAGKELEKLVLRGSSFAQNVAQHGHKRSEWYRVYGSDKVDARGQNLRKILRDLAIEKFPNYELDSEKGRQAAAEEIKEMLKSVT